MSKRRIVITGMGVVSPFGTDVDVFYEALLAGKSAVRTIDTFSCDQFPTKFAAFIKDFDPGEYLEKKQARRVDKFISYAMVAGKKALEYAGLGTPDARARLDLGRCGIIIGSGMGGMDMFSTSVNMFTAKGLKRMTPFFVPFILTNMAGGMLAMDVGFMGPNYSISTACASGTHSIVAAANHILKGDADLMVTGGVEAAVSSIGLAGFCACRALSERNDEPPRASRPWDRSRDGFVMGEGAGVIVLETLEHATARGAKIYAEYLGGNVSCDAYHITEPRQDGAGVALCVKKALADAGVKPEDVNYVNAHATSTLMGDTAEIAALKLIFKDPEKIVVNATKSMIGHSLGAAGGIEAVVLAKTIATGVAHPTINLEDPEPELVFDAPRVARPIRVKVGMSNSFGFGGHNAVILCGPEGKS